MGVCYAINTDIHQPLIVNKRGAVVRMQQTLIPPGVSNGLFLMLNIEAYERMSGPGDSNGVKVGVAFLHF